MSALRFVPYHRLGDIPNVVVDGAPAPSTRLTLSHWPGSPTPVELLDDLSAQIAFHALERPRLFEGVEVVSNNHFDQDGLASAFTLVEPVAARQRKDRVIDVARAGDFAVFQDRDSMRIAFALGALSDADRSPLVPAVFEGDDDEQCGLLYETLLPRFADALDHPERLRALWEAQDAHLDESLAALGRGAVTVEEAPGLDLAVVTVPEDWAQQATTRFAIARQDAVHPAAVNQATDCLRILTVQGHLYRLECRYESWVMFTSHPVMPRPDLRLLAVELDRLETGTTRWVADAPGGLTPALHTDGADSALAPEALREVVARFLSAAEPAWDPFAPRRSGASPPMAG